MWPQYEFRSHRKNCGVAHLEIVVFGQVRSSNRSRIFKMFVNILKFYRNADNQNTNKQTNKQSNKHTNKQTYKQANKQINEQATKEIQILISAICNVAPFFFCPMQWLQPLRGACCRVLQLYSLLVRQEIVVTYI